MRIHSLLLAMLIDLSISSLALVSGGSAPPIVYTIAGSDSGGGAGIQADLHAIQAMGCHGCSAITCLTAQNSVGVTAVHSPPPEFLQEQLDALISDLPPVAVKVGMLGTKELAIQVGAFLKQLKKRKQKIWVVLDPVMISTSGHRLIEEDAQQAMIEHVFPFIDVLTPNKFEAEALLGRKLKSVEDVEQSARDLINLGASAVFIKGGHTVKGWKDSFAQDYFLSSIEKEGELRFCDGEVGVWLRSNRYKTDNTHGTGCTLSSAMASALALGETERRRPAHEKRGAFSALDCVDAACLAKAYVTAGIHRGVQLGKGPGPVAQTSFPSSSKHFPSVARDAAKDETAFVRSPVGRLMPIVDGSDWVSKLAQNPLIEDIQLRIKNIDSEEEISQIIQECQGICKEHSTRLWVNDHWKLAVEAGCHGVHMGQEDAYRCSLNGGFDVLRKKKIALGVSVHSFAELSVATGLKPSYISLGPIFSTKSKNVEFDPQGLDMITKFRELIPQNIPFMVIGGISDNARVAEVRAAGADSVAVIGAVTNAADPGAAISLLDEAML